MKQEVKDTKAKQRSHKSSSTESKQETTGTQSAVWSTSPDNLSGLIRTLEPGAYRISLPSTKRLSSELGSSPFQGTQESPSQILVSKLPPTSV